MENEVILDVKNLNDKQKRLICSLNSNLLSLLTTKNEKNYFTLGLEIFKTLSEGLKISNFMIQEKGKSKIPYDQQVLEYSIDFLNDSMNSLDH